MEKKTEPPARSKTSRILECSWPWVVRFGGIAIAIYETVFEHTDRPTLLLLAAAMIGLPEFVKLDRRGK